MYFNVQDIDESVILSSFTTWSLEKEKSFSTS